MLREVPLAGDSRATTLRKERHDKTCCLNARGYDHPDADVGYIREPDCCGSPSESWFGEPFLAPDEDPLQALAPGTARRAALDDALAEIAAGLTTPSARWKVRYGLMLGLERVLTEDPARTAAARSPPTPDRRAHGHARRAHRGDATSGRGERKRERLDERRRRGGRGGRGSRRRLRRGFVDDDELPEAEFTGVDPGAVRRFRFRHPTASGKTIAAAGFVEAARHLGILILTHRRLLVAQFKGDLTTEGYGDRFTDAIIAGTAPMNTPITIQTYAWFARHGSELDRNAYHLVICDEAHTALGRRRARPSARSPSRSSSG